MKIIDFEKKGNVVKFYLGDDNCKDYWGDDWDDRPYEHNAGEVYEEYVRGTAEVYFPFDTLVMEPCEDWHYDYNSPYCKEDMKKRKVPCIIAVPKMFLESEWDNNCFSQYAGNDSIIKFYFNDAMSPGRYIFDCLPIYNDDEIVDCRIVMKDIDNKIWN